MSKFQKGDIVYFREHVIGDSYDPVTNLYIPDGFEEMVGKRYRVYGISPSGRIQLEDYFNNHDGAFSGAYLRGACVLNHIGLNLIQNTR